MSRNYILGLLFLGFGLQQGLAQTERDLNQEVKVVKAYKPVISDAKRISELPKIVDTVRFVPTFSYAVYTNPLSEKYEPVAIKAAKMVGEPLKSIRGHQLKLGAGNYSSLYGDYRYNNLRSKKYDLGIHLMHYSSNGKVTLENDQKEKVGYSQQLAEIAGKAFLKEGVMRGKLFYHRKGVRYYGFPNIEPVFIVPPTSDRDQELTGKQKYTDFGFEAGYATHFRDEDRLNFSADLGYTHFKDDFITEQDLIRLKGNLLQRKQDASWGIEGDISIYNTKGLRYFDEKEKLQEDRKSGIVKFNPYYLLQPGRWNIRLGISSYIAIGDDSDLKLYPDLNFEYQAIERILTLFAGVGGALEVNDYMSIVRENPYVYSGLNVENTDHQFHLIGGLKGNLASNASFRLSGEYSIIRNDYFFVKHEVFADLEKDILPLEIYGNKFGVVYDDVNLFKLSADFDFKWNEKLNLGAMVKVYQYGMDQQEKAWHKPAFDLRVSSDYRYSSKWQFRAEVFVLGERSVMRNEGVKTLDAVYDLNLGANYRINEMFSAFGNFNNMLADKYYRWDGYPSLGFNALVGLRASF